MPYLKSSYLAMPTTSIDTIVMRDDVTMIDECIKGPPTSNTHVKKRQNSFYAVIVKVYNAI